ncbi:MAG: S9 family peptidase [Saprospiraceae bacterium]|jgi:dipeptidyl aminopeptidase/acylaminoacyl peptidase|nr:S9 family peptidase [Saprospiraceae bacterium]
MLKHISCLFFLLPFAIQAQSTYKQPPADVASIVLAAPTPMTSTSPTNEAVMLVDYNPNPGIATLAQPFLRLAGLRINPTLNCRQNITEYTGITIRWLMQEAPVKITLPADGALAGMPRWSPDGRKIAFGIQKTEGVELWMAEAWTGESHRVGNFYLNDVLGSAFEWMHDNERLLARIVPPYRGPAPVPAPAPSGPTVEETTAGKLAQVRTFQDLLQNADDERLFEYYAACQLVTVSSSTAKVVQLCAGGLYTDAEWSPDEKYLLVTTLKRPFSYSVQYDDFSRKTEIWDQKGKFVRTVAEFPVTDDTPRQGVVNGPRAFRWQALHPARLLWSEALDGGDPTNKADFRDKLLRLDAPFSADPTEVLKTQHRLAGMTWTAEKDIVLLAEFDRDRRWSTTYRLDLNNPAGKTVLFDRSLRDDYNNPGSPVTTLLPTGDRVLLQDGDWAWFSAAGASPKGNFPRLDKINLKTGKKETVFQCPANAYEEFVMFDSKNRERIVTRYQSKTEPPNLFVTDLKTKARKALTAFQDPAPQLTGVEKRLVKYTRKDGVPLSGTLYLPPGYKPGQRLPLFMWAYPLEYSDAATAGQVRGSENTFTYYRNDSPLFFVTQGYAVLMDATMPIVGDPETMNNTFVEQAVTSGRAAIDYLDSLGIIDRTRVGVGGHSYGAFMTANLLAHSDDYAFGIARSGAYNRTLTPFGFQSERRSFWEAPEVYMNVSPFTHANKINEPLLLIHGEADNNSGTFPIQSERLFQAIKGNGGNARLVLLPHESHGYRARESVLHVLSEMFEWADRHGKAKVERP